MVEEVTSVGIESGAMEGDRRLVGGREEEEGEKGLQQQGPLSTWYSG